MERTPVASHQVNWPAIRKCEVTMRTAVFHTGSGLVIVPRRVFPDSDAYFDFVEKALEFRRKALEGALTGFPKACKPSASHTIA